MNSTALTALISVVSVFAAIGSFFLGWAGRSRSVRQEIRSEANHNATLHADVEYIKRGVDDMRLEQKAQAQRYDVLAERVTRVEESAKQAHHRLNRLDGGRE